MLNIEKELSEDHQQQGIKRIYKCEAKCYLEKKGKTVVVSVNSCECQ